MARFFVNAKVVVQWDDGRVTQIGTIEVQPDKKGTKAGVCVRVFRCRLGWDLIRTGMRIMLGRRQWKQENGGEWDE